MTKNARAWLHRFGRKRAETILSWPSSKVFVRRSASSAAAAAAASSSWEARGAERESKRPRLSDLRRTTGVTPEVGCLPVVKLWPPKVEDEGSGFTTSILDSKGLHAEPRHSEPGMVTGGDVPGVELNACIRICLETVSNQSRVGRWTQQLIRGWKGRVRILKS